MRVTKKPSGGVIFFFFAVSRVSRLTRLTAKKKNYTTIRFFCYAHLQRKKKITRITTYTHSAGRVIVKVCKKLTIKADFCAF